MAILAPAERPTDGTWASGASKTISPAEAGLLLSTSPWAGDLATDTRSNTPGRRPIAYKGYELFRRGQAQRKAER